MCRNLSIIKARTRKCPGLSNIFSSKVQHAEMFRAVESKAFFRHYIPGQIVGVRGKLTALEKVTAHTVSGFGIKTGEEQTDKGLRNFVSNLPAVVGALRLRTDERCLLHQANQVIHTGAEAHKHSAV